MLASLLLPLGLQGSVLNQLNDQQLCDVIHRNIEGQQQPFQYPVTALTTSVDCKARHINGKVTTAVSGPAFDIFVTNFMAVARAGVCNLSDPTMATFHKRGWKFAYRLEAVDGSVQEHVLAC